jgi:DNA-binding MarR family transcriptional regulator
MPDRKLRILTTRGEVLLRVFGAGRVRLKDLVATSRHSQQSTRNAVSELEAAGLIVRSPPRPGDAKNSVNFEMTEAGRDLLSAGMEGLGFAPLTRAP